MKPSPVLSGVKEICRPSARVAVLLALACAVSGCKPTSASEKQEATFVPGNEVIIEKLKGDGKSEETAIQIETDPSDHQQRLIVEYRWLVRHFGGRDQFDFVQGAGDRKSDPKKPGRLIESIVIIRKDTGKMEKIFFNFQDISPIKPLINPDLK